MSWNENGSIWVQELPEGKGEGVPGAVDKTADLQRWARPLTLRPTVGRLVAQSQLRPQGGVPLRSIPRRRSLD